VLPSWSMIVYCLERPVIIVSVLSLYGRSDPNAIHCCPFHYTVFE